MEPPPTVPTVSLYAGGCWHTVPLVRREWLAVGQTLQGPALVLESIGTLVLAAGWRAEVLPQGELLLQRPASGEPAAVAPAATTCTITTATSGAAVAVTPVRSAASAAAASVDPVRLELFHHRFAAIAEQMGNGCAKAPAP